MPNQNKPNKVPIVWTFARAYGDWKANLCYGEDTTDSFGSAADLEPGEEWDVTSPSYLLSTVDGMHDCDGVPLGLEYYGPGNCGLIVSVYGTGSTKLKDLSLEIRGVGVPVGTGNSFELSNIPKVNPGVVYNKDGKDMLVSALIPHLDWNPANNSNALYGGYVGAGHGCLRTARHRVIVKNLTNRPKHAVVLVDLRSLFRGMDVFIPPQYRGPTAEVAEWRRIYG